MSFKVLGIYLKFIFCPLFIVVKDSFKVWQIGRMDDMAFIVSFFLVNSNKLINFFLNLYRFLTNDSLTVI